MYLFRRNKKNENKNLKYILIEAINNNKNLNLSLC